MRFLGLGVSGLGYLVMDLKTVTKIGYLVPQFPGQTHIFFWREIAEMEKRGAEVALLSTRKPPSGLIAHSWSDAAMARTHYLGTPNPLDTLSALPRLPWGELLAEGGRDFLKDVAISAGAAVALKRYAKAQGITHVHVHSCGRGALIARLSKHLGGPTYSITLHGPLQDYGPGQRVKWRHAEFATIITDKLIAEMRAEMADDMPDRIILQPMGVDTDHFAPEDVYTAAGPNEPLRIFSCARLNRVKGHQDHFAALRQLIDEGRDIRLEIAGEDDAGGSGFRAELEAEVVRLGLQDHVTLLGAIDADTVRAKLLGAHMFVLASWAEPLGVVYMEAMSCGLPTIGTAAGGVPELITDGVDGILVPPQDPAALARAIARVADDPALAANLSTAGHARIVSGYGAGRGAETLIREITQSPSPSGTIKS